MFLRLLPIELGNLVSLGDPRRTGCWPSPGISAVLLYCPNSMGSLALGKCMSSGSRVLPCGLFTLKLSQMQIKGTPDLTRWWQSRKSSKV